MNDVLGPHAELFDTVPDLVSVDAEQLACMRLVASRALERLHQEPPLDVVEVDASGRSWNCVGATDPVSVEKSADSTSSR